jgi:hypothetical protein
VAEERAPGQARAVGDLRDGSVVVALLGEQPQRRRHQPLTYVGLPSRHGRGVPTIQASHHPDDATGPLSYHVAVLRGKDVIARTFNGRRLLDPGLVLASYWRPENGRPDQNADRAMACGGIAAL